MTTSSSSWSISGQEIISVLSRSRESPTDPNERKSLNSHVIQSRAVVHTAANLQEMTSQFDITEFNNIICVCAFTDSTSVSYFTFGRVIPWRRQ